MFFRSDYEELMTPEEDRPEKTGMARFLELLGPACAPLLQLNLLFLLTCLPVVTIPPSLLAMHQVVRRLVLDQPVRCLRDYFAAFRQNFVRSYGVFLATALPMGCAGYGMWFYLRLAAGNPLMYLPFVFCSTVFLTALLASPYLYGLLSGGKSLRESVRPALLLGLGKPLRAVLANIVYYVPLGAGIALFPLSGLYLVITGFSLPCFVGFFFLRTELGRVERKEAER